MTPALRPHRRRASSGYTLMEMMVVLVIMGIIIMIMIGRVDSLLPKYRVRAAVRDIASELRLARAQAMSTGMPHYVQYNLETGEFWILAPEEKKEGDLTVEEEDTTENAFKAAEYVWAKTMEQKLPDGVKIEKILWSAGREADLMPVTIECSPYGSIRSHTIWVTGTEDGSKFTIEPSPLTGFVAFSEGHVEPAALEEAAE
ncbi:MAG: prepilin-type N-terminal cleavage/methylation domain-containing protein [Candidatus Brocadiae bacterium]|nr:prepilin-type N-terminal cleavage/methylation domain-containing protein [Candidatus Brocadiia bacterium]